MTQSNSKQTPDVSSADSAETTNTSRRGFIGCVTAAGAATALDQSAAAATASVEEKDLTAEYFESYIGETFRASTGGIQSHPLKLVSVDRHERNGRPAEFRDPFSLLFRADASIPLEQDSAIVSKPGFGKLRISLTPVLAEGDGTMLEAIYG